MQQITRLSKVLLLLFFSGIIISHASADPAINDSNLIVNGGFEQMTNGAPDGWQILEGTSGSQATFPKAEGKGNVANISILHDGKKGAYMAQWVNLEPNQNYRLSVQAMMTGGKITFAVGNTGLNVRLFGEAKEELPMAPNFWDESWLNSIPFVPGQWREASFDFNSKDIKRVLVSLGGFFAAGSYSFDNVALEKINK
jgi:hypothetical protein